MLINVDNTIVLFFKPMQRCRFDERYILDRDNKQPVDLDIRVYALCMYEHAWFDV